MVRAKSYKEHLLKQLKKPRGAASYLNAALQDGDPHVFLLALRDIAEAKGGMSWLADEAELNRENLYRILSLKGNPSFLNLLAVMDAVGLEFSVSVRKSA